MIRKYEESDIEELLEVWYKSSSLAHPFMDEAFLQKEKQNVRELYIPNTKTWVYERHGGIDGFIAMMGNEVGAIFVRPENHGQGIGKELMDFVKGLYRELEVEVFKENKIGRAFYDKYGFVTIKEYLHEETGQVVFRMKLSSLNG